MWNALGQIATLSSDDCLFLLESIAELTRTEIQVTLLPYARWRGRLQRASSSAGTATQHADALAKTRHLVRLFSAVVRRYPKRTSCLVRALSLHTLFGQRGIDNTLRIGVRKDRSEGSDAQRGRLAAHAWLEQTSGPIYEHPGDDSYLVLEDAPFTGSRPGENLNRG